MGEFTRQQRVQQCRKPVGEIGLSVGEEMNEHHLSLWQWGLGQVEIPRNATVLDIGCGGGRSLQILAELAPEGKVFGIDYSADMVAMSREVNAELIAAGRVDVREESVSKLPYENETFDLAVAFETYYFWPDQLNDLREICRTLKPGGKVLLVNEVYDHPDFAERNQYYIETAGMKIHTPEGFDELLTNAGFKICSIEPKVEKNWITIVAEKI